MFSRFDVERLRLNRGLRGRLWRKTGAIIAVALGFLCAGAGLSAAEETALWGALHSGGHVALLRHAIAPGTGDPSDFSLRDCSTQRNLSDKGRGQAARIATRFRTGGIRTARVLSSQWCRCLETARLLDLGPIEELPALNSFFRRYERRDAQTRALQEWLASQDLDEPLVLVTHQVNITALTNVYPASGEVVIVRASPGHLSVVGTIRTD